MENLVFVVKELPIKQVEQDPDQPRKDFGVEDDRSSLFLSIREFGIGDPIKVTSIGDARYKIIDGHRRYRVATRLNLKTVPCLIYPQLEPGKLEALRFAVQNNRRNWKPLERMNALHLIKSKLNFRTNEKLSEFLGLSNTMVANAMQLRDMNMEYLGLMEKYNLNVSNRLEFLRLKPKLRKIKNIETDDIVRILFDKVKEDILTTSLDFRDLADIFRDASVYEDEIHEFLSNRNATVTELKQKIAHDGLAPSIRNLIQVIAQKKKQGTAFSTKEKDYLGQLSQLLKKLVK